jgi:hypothetical protein
MRLFLSPISVSFSFGTRYNAVYGWNQNIFLQKVYSLGILFVRMKNISYRFLVRPDI